jgi:hypothetical protein
MPAGNHVHRTDASFPVHGLTMIDRILSPTPGGPLGRMPAAPRGLLSINSLLNLFSILDTQVVIKTLFV